MDNIPGKKLKRGLQDISPLFQNPSTVLNSAIPGRAPFDVQFVSVCTPDHDGDAFLANAYLASQMVRRSNFFASLVSIMPGMNRIPPKTTGSFPTLESLHPRITRISLSHREVWGLTQNGAGENGESHSSVTERSSFLVFLEFEPIHFRSLARIALLLDRVIFFIDPCVESLQEAFRFMKTFWNLNRDIEFFLLFKEPDRWPAREEFLYERFCLITSRFLGITPAWLGTLAFPKSRWENSTVEQNIRFNLESVLTGEGLHRPLSPEKNRFWHPLEGILQKRFQDEMQKHGPIPR